MNKEEEEKNYFVMLTLVNKSWKSLYSYKTGKIYLHLKNNELVSLNFSITNKNITNYSNNQRINTLTAPPPNSTLFYWKMSCTL